MMHDPDDQNGTPVTNAVDLESVAEEVREVIATYEAAIVANDAEALIALFWNSSDAVRAAPNGFLVGAEEIADFRRRRPAMDYRRDELRLKVTALSSDVVIAALEWQRSETIGYQTQTWLRTPDGWRVAMGHVSTPTGVHPSSHSRDGLK
jgi:ketosteroid isomerase-like protein